MWLNIFKNTYVFHDTNLANELQKDLVNGRQVNIRAYKACGPPRGH